MILRWEKQETRQRSTVCLEVCNSYTSSFILDNSLLDVNYII